MQRGFCCVWVTGKLAVPKICSAANLEVVIHREDGLDTVQDRSSGAANRQGKAIKTAFRDF